MPSRCKGFKLQCMEGGRIKDHIVVLHAWYDSPRIGNTWTSLHD